jgi:predicted transcriptional regulator
MSEVRIHVSPLDGFFDDAAKTARVIDAGGEVRAEADIAFESMDMLLAVLTPNRWRLLRDLKRSGPMSIRKLAQSLQRDYRGVHSDVTALRETGLIERRPDGVILVPWTRITAEMSITEAA